MTTDEQIKKMRLEILGDVANDKFDDVFKIKLEDAKWLALDMLYPFDKDKQVLPDRYSNWQVRCAIELYNAIGQEGYVSYAENGLSYTKASGLISTSLMNEITPYAGVPK